MGKLNQGEYMGQETGWRAESGIWGCKHSDLESFHPSSVWAWEGASALT